MHADGWKLDGYLGRFQSARAHGTCDVLRPDLGIASLSIDSKPLQQVSILGPTLPRPPHDQAANQVETYTRCGDLVAIYAPSAEYPFRSQTYWRLNSHPLEVQKHEALLAIELVASQQTDLLDSAPSLTVSSLIPADEIHYLDRGGRFTKLDHSALRWTISKSEFVGCVLYRLPGERLSYVEIVHPLDFAASSLTMSAEGTGKIASVEHALFAHRLEKGVILRSRILGIWLNRLDDIGTAIAHYEAFSRSELPLTT